MLVLLFILAGMALWYAIVARSEARQARATVTELQRDLSVVRSDLATLKTLARRGSEPAAEREGADTPAPMTPAPQPAPASDTATTSAAPRVAPPVKPMPAAAPARPAARALPPSRPPSPPPQWINALHGWLFGGNLVAKLGLLILFIGIGFLLKYTAARVTLPIELRLAGIVLADIALLAWGRRIRTERPAISLPIQGTALAILMLVTFGAFRLYHLVPGSLAFVLLFVLTAFTCVLAVLQDAQWLAIFGIAGGFAAPILASSGGGSHIGLFSYYALLNCGVFMLAVLRSWRPLNLIGFAFTFAIGTAWGVLRYQPENYLSAQLFLLLFFLFYVAIALSYAWQQAVQLKNYIDSTLIFGTPMLAFGLQFGLVRGYELGVACSALALGLFYIALATLLSRRREKYGLLADTFLALGVVFGTLAMPFALDGRWTSAAWALEGAGIIWVGLRQKQRLAWMFGLLVQALAGLTLLALTAWQWPMGAPQLDLFATPILGAAMILAGATFSSWALMRHQDTGIGMLSHGLLLWSGLWWYGMILPTLAGWLAAHYQLLLGHENHAQGSDLPWSFHLLLMAAFSAPVLHMARRLQWFALRWSGAATGAGLAAATLFILGDLYLQNHLPRSEAWLGLALQDCGWRRNLCCAPGHATAGPSQRTQ